MGEVTATSWNTRHFDPVAYGSPGNHACLWDIAREQLVREGYEDPSGAQIQMKVNEIVGFHNQQTEQPGFRKISNPDVIGDGQVIFVPPDGMTVPAGTQLKEGDKVQSPDGNTVLSVETVKNDKGQAVTGLVVYRDDGQGFTNRAELQAGSGVKTVEVTADGRLRIVDKDDKEHFFGDGKSKDARLVVQNDGNVVVYGGDGKALWSSHSQRGGPDSRG